MYALECKLDLHPFVHILSEDVGGLTMAMSGFTCFEIFLFTGYRFQCFSKLCNLHIYWVKVLYIIANQIQSQMNYSIFTY
jgi:hypothetical protein